MTDALLADVAEPAAPHEATAHAHRGYTSEKAAYLRRLKLIEGQVRGIAGMVADDRYCVDVLTQIASVKSALDGLAMQLLEQHARGCVSQAVQRGEGEAAIGEMMTVFRKLTR